MLRAYMVTSSLFAAACIACGIYALTEDGSVGGLFIGFALGAYIFIQTLFDVDRYRRQGWK